MIVEAVVDQHLERCSHLWEARCELLVDSDITLSELTHHDREISSHLEGLRLALQSALGNEDADLPEEPAALFAAVAAAVCCGARDELQRLAAGAADANTAAAVADGLAWDGGEHSDFLTIQLLSAEDPFQLEAGLRSAVEQRLLFPATVIENTVAAAHPRFLWGIGELGMTDLHPQCRAFLSADDVGQRFCAARSLLIMGDESARGILQEIAESDDSIGTEASQLAGRGQTYPQVADWVQRLTGDPARLGRAILVAGATGDPMAAWWLVDCMAVEDVCAVAGAAFSQITGVDLEHEDLTADAEDSGDDGQESDLPVPDPTRVRAWWTQNEGRFQAGTRYLAGQQISHDTLWSVLAEGSQRHREAAAIELALMDPGRPLFNVRGRGDRQLRLTQDQSVC